MDSIGKHCWKQHYQTCSTQLRQSVLLHARTSPTQADRRFEVNAYIEIHHADATLIFHICLGFKQTTFIIFTLYGVPPLQLRRPTSPLHPPPTSQAPHPPSALSPPLTPMAITTARPPVSNAP